MARFIVNVLVFIIALNLGEAIFDVDISLGEALVLLGAWFLGDFAEGLIFGER